MCMIRDPDPFYIRMKMEGRNRIRIMVPSIFNLSNFILFVVDANDFVFLVYLRIDQLQKEVI
jgi:hypothetical protein